MKRITFPHMGNLQFAVRGFFEEMGLKVSCPPDISKKTLDLGVKYSPEFACLPFKINLGNFIEALEQGANIIVMGGGVGPCRFGYYGEVQREILKELGYDFEMIILDPRLKQTLPRLLQLFGLKNIKRLYRAARLTWVRICSLEKIHKLVLTARPREQDRGSVDRIYREFQKKLALLHHQQQITDLTGDIERVLMEIIQQSRALPVIRIGVVGEIYVVMEPFVNLELEQKLGRLG
ncbi:MAG: CoA protein activase, partial [Bacillota bacterium]